MLWRVLRGFSFFYILVVIRGRNGERLGGGWGFGGYDEKMGWREIANKTTAGTTQRSQSATRAK